MKVGSIVSTLAVISCLLCRPALAIEVKDLKAAVSEGKLGLNFRYRYEYVDQDGIGEDANASTLRGRLTWTSGNVGKWRIGVEGDYVALLGSERYNSTENGRTEFPVVADPEGFDLNQAFIKYEGDKLALTGGRQRILQTDQRFVGGVGWRQNEQTYDAIRAELKPTKRLSVDYSYVWDVNRIFGPNDGAQPSDWRSNSHFLLTKFALSDKHALEGFAYLLDFENANGIPNSAATYGVSYRGKLGPLKATATYATQTDYADSPLDYDADFISVALSTQLSAVTVSAGYELLGSDGGNVAFRTPLATLHKWQGWADKFLGTPANGIKDAYIGAAGKLGPVKVSATYHDYRSDEGGISYGDEINIVANYQIADGVNVQLKFADYDADEFASDTTKVWLSFVVAL